MTTLVAEERFREVPSTSVPRAELDIGCHVLVCVSRALGLPPRIHLRWFRPVNGIDDWETQRRGGVFSWPMFSGDERTAGRMYQGNANEIWVRCGRGPDRVAFVTAHELRHIWQVPKYGYLTDATVDTIDAMHARLEADADEFAETACEILLKGIRQ